jgi:hypothetical protein
VGGSWTSTSRDRLGLSTARSRRVACYWFLLPHGITVADRPSIAAIAPAGLLLLSSLPAQRKMKGGDRRLQRGNSTTRV